MKKLSAVIITRNEERNIRRCLESLPSEVSEIVILDSGSTDNTISIAEELGAKVHHRDFTTFAEQKNHAAELASGEYILNLDADECLSEELRDNIVDELGSQVNYESYSMNRRTNFCGSWIGYSGWYPDRKVRLWKKGKAHWGGKNPHEFLKVDHPSQVKHLKGDILHYAFDTISEHLDQIEKYSSLAAQYAFETQKTFFPIIHIYFGPLYTFVKKYILQLGILDGKAGWLIAKNTAFSKYLKYKKLLELKRSE